jgi:hypothetical protein
MIPKQYEQYTNTRYPDSSNTWSSSTRPSTLPPYQSPNVDIWESEFSHGEEGAGGVVQNRYSSVHGLRATQELDSSQIGQRHELATVAVRCAI